MSSDARLLHSSSLMVVGLSLRYWHETRHPQRAHYVIITSVLRQNESTSFWRKMTSLIRHVPAGSELACIILLWLVSMNIGCARSRVAASYSISDKQLLAVGVVQVASWTIYSTRIFLWLRLGYKYTPLIFCGFWLLIDLIEVSIWIMKFHPIGCINYPCTNRNHDYVLKWKHFPRNWPFVRGIHRSRWSPHTKASDAELWCFLWSASE